MKISKKIIVIIILAIVVSTVIPITSIGILLTLNNNANNDPNSVEITNIQTMTGLSYACIMIEANGKRIYIDPYNFPSEYNLKPADAIFITHSHFDHYDPRSIDLVSQDSSEFIGPASCDDFITQYDGIAVMPGENGSIAGFEYETTPAYNAFHPKENNWCGYIITVNGIRILHAGDSKLVSEYELLGVIDVVCFPIDKAVYELFTLESVKEAIEIFQPKYVFPIHYGDDDLTEFKSEIEATYPSVQVHLNSDRFSSDPLVIAS